MVLFVKKVFLYERNINKIEEQYIVPSINYYETAVNFIQQKHATYKTHTLIFFTLFGIILVFKLDKVKKYFH